jgi:hypothetical protein
MLAGRTVTELMKSGEERVRLDAAKYYTARRRLNRVLKQTLRKKRAKTARVSRFSS